MSKGSSTKIRFHNWDSKSGCVRGGLAKAAIEGQKKSRFVKKLYLSVVNITVVEVSFLKTE